MSNWRVSRQDAYDLVGKDEAEKMKSEKNLKWSEIADEIIKVKSREMVSNYVENIFGHPVFSVIVTMIGVLSFGIAIGIITYKVSIWRRAANA